MTRLTAGSALLLGLLALGAATAQPVVRHAANARFEDVRDDLKAAIESRGLVIDHHSHVGAMLDRTGADVGSTRKLYADAQSFQFCSARVSRRMMEADPASVVLCPYSIVVYALADQPGRVVVAYRRPVLPGAGPAARTALREVDALLDGIARDAVGRR